MLFGPNFCHHRKFGKFGPDALSLKQPGSPLFLPTFFFPISPPELCTPAAPATILPEPSPVFSLSFPLPVSLYFSLSFPPSLPLALHCSLPRVGAATGCLSLPPCAGAATGQQSSSSESSKIPASSPHLTTPASTGAAPATPPAPAASAVQTSSPPHSIYLSKKKKRVVWTLKTSKNSNSWNALNSAIMWLSFNLLCLLLLRCWVFQLGNISVAASPMNNFGCLFYLVAMMLPYFQLNCEFS